MIDVAQIEGLPDAHALLDGLAVIRSGSCGTLIRKNVPAFTAILDVWASALCDAPGLPTCITLVALSEGVCNMLFSRLHRPDHQNALTKPCGSLSQRMLSCEL